MPSLNTHAQKQQILLDLAADLAHKVVKKYRVEHDRAVVMVVAYFKQKPDLLNVIESASHVKAVIRTRIYKDAARDVTRKIYYDLRRYQEQDDITTLVDALAQAQTPLALEQARLALVKNHISTAERLVHSHEFWQILSQYWGEPKRILDIGCGIMPLLFPFDGIPLSQYVALDKSADSVKTISAYKKNASQYTPQIACLETRQWSIDQGWDSLYGVYDTVFDVALLLKLVPVIARQEPSSLAILARTPARRLIVTGCKTAMVKQRNISRRERAIILHFSEQAHLEVIDTFETPDEIGFVLKPNVY